jgi:uncharacterized protein (DUF305 family)
MSSGHVGVDDDNDVDGIGDGGGDIADIGVDVDDVDGGRGGGSDDVDGDGGWEDDPGDTIVLPWWQHPFNITVIAVTAALIAGMIGWMIGDSGARRDAGTVDVGFLQDMREHHEQAVGMSFLFLSLDDTEPGLQTVARSIVFGQGIEIGRMIQLLREFGEAEVNEGDTSMAWMGHSVPLGEMPGMASDDEFDELGTTSGAEADRMFVELMVRHHEGGIEMADYAAANASVDEVRSMASAIAHSQRDEIIEIERLID